jgi:hypothetical protein
MAEFDQKHMNDAIALAQECAPFEERIPLVGSSHRHRADRNR